jgi:prepilin-type N-terminal cleavage/methylation domain-containing protein
VRRNGYTLLELIAVLTIIAILAAIAAPNLFGMVRRERTKAALNLFTTDFFLARSVAVRTGHRVEIHLTNSGACSATGRTIAADGWTIVSQADGKTVKRVVPPALNGVCLESNNDRVLVINSRGLLAPFENRTVRALGPGFADTVTISVLGRAYRRY